MKNQPFIRVVRLPDVELVDAFRIKNVDIIGHDKTKKELRVAALYAPPLGLPDGSG